jgi:hypothetical protein
MADTDIASQCGELEAALVAANPELAGGAAAEAFLEAWDSAPRSTSLSHIPAEAAAIAGQAGGSSAALLQQVLLRAIVHNSRPSGLTLPAVIDEERRLSLARILDAMSGSRARQFSLDRAAYRRDLAICRGVLLPCGVEAADPVSGVPRRLLLSGGLRQALGAAWYILARCGDFRPFVELHFDRRDIEGFDADGYTALYHRLAGLLRANPHLRGVTSASWWHDPALGEAFDFIDAIPRQHGAAFFRVGSDDHATADALRFSAERQHRHAAGLYQPAVWLRIWARRDLLRWDETTR